MKVSIYMILNGLHLSGYRMNISIPIFLKSDIYNLPKQFTIRTEYE